MGKIIAVSFLLPFGILCFYDAYNYMGLPGLSRALKYASLIEWIVGFIASMYSTFLILNIIYDVSQTSSY